MLDFPGFPFLSSSHEETHPILLMTTSQAEDYLKSISEGGRATLKLAGFSAQANSSTLIEHDGKPAALFCYGDEADLYTFASMVSRLPEGTWKLDSNSESQLKNKPNVLKAFVLGFGLEAYRFGPARNKMPKLVMPKGIDQELDTIKAIWLARDLINKPANLLGPSDLAATAESIFAELKQSGKNVSSEIISGVELDKEFPALAAVGNGSDRDPCAFIGKYTSAKENPTISLVGKGVVFDTGGYDLKPSSSMRLMKKDMGGAATVLALAYLLIKSDLPVNVELRLGCVENSLSGHAMRPGDILNTRKGLTVEVGNTDAEGRLVLCDLLAQASESKPDLIVDMATLTGAARVALGPDMPPVFSNHHTLAADLQDFTKGRPDPFWAMPLWEGYRSWMKSDVADLSNLSSKPFGGAITAALYLDHFVPKDCKWIHIDTFGWNDSSKPGRPQGGEAVGLLGLYDWLKEMRFKKLS